MPKVSSMVTRVAGCRVPVTISTMFSTTATPGKKDITSACSGCKAHFWFQLYRKCATAAPTMKFAAHSVIRQLGCCHASPVRTPVNQE